MANIEDISQLSQAEQHKVWDLPVRLFHWALVFSIVGAYVTNRLGVSYFKYHVWFGYSVIVLVSFRIIWGIIGTYHAQFWNFVRGPSVTLRYAANLLKGDDAHYAGHNPLGAWMVLLLLVALGIQAITGLFSNDEIFNMGPLYGYISKDLSLQLTSLHRQLFYWIVAAISLHILAVLAHYIFKKENLIKAMITGRKPSQALAEQDGISSSRTWLAATLILVLSGILVWIVSHAPIPVDDGF